MKIVVVSVLSLIAASCTQTPSPDLWEGLPISPAEMKLCHPVPRQLVVPVSNARRPEAMPLLAHDEAITLTDVQAASLIEQTVPTGGLAGRLIDQAVTDLNARGGGFSTKDELADLDLFRTEHRLSALRPYLTRAIAKFEGTGAFTADDCGAVLNIIHGSLGHSTPPSTRVPVVVFLDHLPKRVHAAWSIAE